MYCDPLPVNVPRLRRLKLEGHANGRPLIYCPDCDFQMPPESVGINQCRCGGQLMFVTVSDELRAIIDGTDKINAPDRATNDLQRIAPGRGTFGQDGS